MSLEGCYNCEPAVKGHKVAGQEFGRKLKSIGVSENDIRKGVRYACVAFLRLRNREKTGERGNVDLENGTISAEIRENAVKVAKMPFETG